MKRYDAGDTLLQGSIHMIRGDLDRAGDVLKLLQEAARWMESNNIQQWVPGQFKEEDIAGYFADRQVYLAMDGDQVAGLFTMQFSDPQYWGSRNDDSYAYIHRLTVAGSYRNMKLGEDMLHFAAAKAQELGCKGLRLDTIAHNVKINRYYQSLNFRYMGTSDMGGGRLVNLYELNEDSGDQDELMIRYFSEADFGYLQKWSVSPEYLKQWAGPSLTFPLDDEQLVKYMDGANHPAQSDMLLYSAVHKASQQVVGHISLSAIDRINRSARVSRVVVDPEFQGRGIGRRMLDEILRIGFEGLELHRLSLGVFDFNIAARKSYETAGFLHEGVMREAALFGGQFVDCIEMSILDREWKSRQTRLHQWS